MENAQRILLIEDNETLRRDIALVLEFIGFSVLAIDAAYWEDSVEAYRSDSFSALMLGDYQQAENNLLSMMTRIQQWSGGVPVITLRHENTSKLVPAFSRQIIAALFWPCSQHDIIASLHTAQIYRELWNHAHQQNLNNDIELFQGLTGKSEAMRQVRLLMDQVVRNEVNVLITGESGTGKEVVARNLHDFSARVDAPFVPVNCGAIPQELLESELFGHEAGVFAGATYQKRGRLELASGGTLFLDEIAQLPLHMQVKLLRVFKEQAFERVGGSETIKLNVRLICASNKPLEPLKESGLFREDFYYHINVFPIQMPPLRERADDIPVMLNELIHQMEQQGRGSIRLSAAAIISLCKHPWMGNVREMMNLLERLAILFPNGVVGFNDLPAGFQHGDGGSDESGMVDLFPESLGVAAQKHHSLAILPIGGLDLKAYLGSIEKSLIQQALEDCNNVVARAAEKLQIRRTTLVEKMRKYSLQRYEEDVV